MTPEKLASLFHDVYETLAPAYGYETRKETREFDSNSPNGKLMVAVCKFIIETELTTLPSREAVEKSIEQSIIDQHIALERAKIYKDLIEIINGMEDLGWINLELEKYFTVSSVDKSATDTRD